MATKKKTVINEYVKDIPMNLDNHPFFWYYPRQRSKSFNGRSLGKKKKIFSC